jgi:hypothetical protein
MDEKKVAIDRISHDLLSAWMKTKEILMHYASPSEKKDIAIAEDYIKQFHLLDRSSFTFRYPITKNLNHVIGEQKRIDLPNLRDRMAELTAFFDGCEGMLSQMAELNSKLEAYDW